MNRHELAAALFAAEAQLRETATRLAVRDGFACPEVACGRRYRHQHDDVWWPPEGEPWPPRKGVDV